MEKRPFYTELKNIKGNPFEFYEGDKNYTQNLGCKAVEYRKASVKKISKLAADNAVENVFKNLYPEE